LSQLPKSEQSLAPISSILDDPEARLRLALTRAIRLSCRSRQQIADTMSELLGRRISLNAVNTWTNRTKTRVRFPAAWIPAFCEAAMTDIPQLALLSAKHRTRLEIKKDLESLRSAITALLVVERKRVGRSPQTKKARGKQ
jgi:hypothetical protein